MFESCLSASLHLYTDYLVFCFGHIQVSRHFQCCRVVMSCNVVGDLDDVGLSLGAGRVRVMDPGSCPSLNWATMLLRASWPSAFTSRRCSSTSGRILARWTNHTLIPILSSRWCSAEGQENVTQLKECFLSEKVLHPQKKPCFITWIINHSFHFEPSEVFRVQVMNVKTMLII